MPFPFAPEETQNDLFGMSNSESGFYMPNMEELTDLIKNLPPDPSIPIRNRPSTELLLERKRDIMDYWRPRNLRMKEDEQIYKLLTPVEARTGSDDIGAAETLILNDPYVLVEKISNMISSQEPIISLIPKDVGMKEAAQKVEDFLYWWREEANIRWTLNLNNNLCRDEIHYLALRGWLAARIMLDLGDPDFPFRYDLTDPIHIYPQRGPKGLRWVFHVYKDSKSNVINDLGWNDEVLLRIEEKLVSLGSRETVEVASYFDEIWHVMFINDEEVWSAPHNYGFVPFVINIASGPPMWRSDDSYGSASSRDITNTGGSLRNKGYSDDDHTRWKGVSVFQGIKDVYSKINKLASAILTEAMKAPNPPIVLFTNPQGETEGKVIDTGIGATNYLVMGQEQYQVVNYGFKPSELGPLLQMLTDARNRGALPSVMYGEGATYLSGFAVNLLTAGARDLLFPLVKAHEQFLQNLFKYLLKLSAELIPFPINMVESDPATGNRIRLTLITPEEIKLVGYTARVYYKNITPQDRQAQAMSAAMLVDKKIISLDTARGEEYLGLRNPSLENKKVLGDLAYFDPDVVKASIPKALLEVDPVMYITYIATQMQKMQREMQMMQMQIAMGQAPKPPADGASEKPSGNSASSPPVPSSAPPAYPPPPPQASQIENPQI